MSSHMWLSDCKSSKLQALILLLLPPSGGVPAGHQPGRCPGHWAGRRRRGHCISSLHPLLGSLVAISGATIVRRALSKVLVMKQDRGRDRDRGMCRAPGPQGADPTSSLQPHKLHILHSRALAGGWDTGHVGDDNDMARLGLELVRARG